MASWLFYFAAPPAVNLAEYGFNNPFPNVYVDTSTTYSSKWRLAGNEWTDSAGVHEIIIVTGAPYPVCGDSNNDGRLNIQDITHLVDVMFLGGRCEP